MFSCLYKHENIDNSIIAIKSVKLYRRNINWNQLSKDTQLDVFKFKKKIDLHYTTYNPNLILEYIKNLNFNIIETFKNLFNWFYILQNKNISIKFY